jgi:hypothetical protein
MTAGAASSQAAPPQRRRRPLLLIVAAVVLLLVAAVVASLLRRNPGAGCRVQADLVPTCGVLIGLAAPQPALADLEQAEGAMGGRADVVYSFHDINDAIPSAYDAAVVARGQILHLDIDARDYSGADRTTVTWRAVADGTYDASLAAQARGVAGLGVPVFVTFDHEPDQASRAAAGTPADFVAAWRHVHQLFTAQGATNAVWVWVVMGLPQTFASSLAFWPGNDVVSWISWEAYDHAGCDSGPADPSRYRTFETAILGFYDYLHAHGAEAGIDVSKPMMISESGTVQLPGAESPTHDWFDEAPGVLRAHPQIRALTLWDHTGSSPGCDFRFTLDPGLLASVRTLVRAGLSPIFPASPQSGGATG